MLCRSNRLCCLPRISEVHQLPSLGAIISVLVLLYSVFFILWSSDGRIRHMSFFFLRITFFTEFGAIRSGVGPRAVRFSDLINVILSSDLVFHMKSWRVSRNSWIAFFVSNSFHFHLALFTLFYPIGHLRFMRFFC